MGSPAPQDRSCPRVLIVDDEDMLRHVMARTLQERGFEVITAADGLEAWDLLRNGGPPVHLVVTDVKMPNLDGPGLAERVRGLPNPPPLIFVSGYGQHDLTGFQPFLAKPFHPDELATLVRQLLNGGSEPQAQVR